MAFISTIRDQFEEQDAARARRIKKERGETDGPSDERLAFNESRRLSSRAAVKRDIATKMLAEVRYDELGEAIAAATGRREEIGAEIVIELDRLQTEQKAHERRRAELLAAKLPPDDEVEKRCRELQSLIGEKHRELDLHLSTENAAIGRLEEERTEAARQCGASQREVDLFRYGRGDLVAAFHAAASGYHWSLARCNMARQGQQRDSENSIRTVRGEIAAAELSAAGAAALAAKTQMDAAWQAVLEE